MIMLNKGLVFVFILSFLINTGCTPEVKKTNDLQKGSKNQTDEANEIKKTNLSQVVQPENLIVKILNFSSSLESEVLKLILPSFKISPTQFEVLEFGFKKSTLFQRKLKKIIVGSLKNYNCQKIEVLELTGESNKNKSVFQVESQCYKPYQNLARVELQKDKIKFIFFNKNWSDLLKTSAGLAEKDRICELQFNNDFVTDLNCSDTVYNLNQSKSDISHSEIKFHTFQFSRNKPVQVLIKASVYKDLLETRLIEMNVPLTGKIKITEKVLKVKDDFAEQQKIELKEVDNSQPEDASESKTQTPEVSEQAFKNLIDQPTLRPEDADLELQSNDNATAASGSVPPAPQDNSQTLDHFENKEKTDASPQAPIQTGEPEFIEER